MKLDKAAFEKQWLESGESGSEIILDTAWRRYQQINTTRPEYTDPTLHKLEATFLPTLEAVKSTSSTYLTFHLPGNKPPWKATGMTIVKGQSVTVLATGRLWRSRMFDLWLGLWYRFGENGSVFNSTDASITFNAETTAELYLGTQFPAQYGDRNGRVQGNLKAYDQIEGGFEVIVIAWKNDAEHTLQQIAKAGDPYLLASKELHRTEQAENSKLPSDWHFLWFLGVSNIFTEIKDGGSRAFHCLTQGNFGIIQKELVCPLKHDTVLSWSWLVSAIPSRLHEDTTVSHDYLSIVTEFENGRDLTYTWAGSFQSASDIGVRC